MILLIIFEKLKEYIKEDFGKFKNMNIKKSVLNKKEYMENTAVVAEKDPAKLGLSSTKTIVFLLWKKKFKIIFSTIAFMLILCVFFAYQSGNTVNTTMSLNYEEGSKGLNPNSTRFNMYELKSNAVLERAIQYLGLTGDITPEQLSEHISVGNANSKAINTEESNYFISTSFNVSYTKNKEAKKDSAKDIMTMICKAYNDVFHENYADKKTALTYNMDDITDMEYVEIGDELTILANQMDEYLSGRVSENGTYKSVETGQTFQTVKRMVQNLLEYDISKYKSFVLETGLAKEKEQFIQTLYYKNSVLDMQYQKSMADYSVRQDGISKYDEAMIGTVMIPAVNEKNEYYMSRTNIGIDYLAKDAEFHLSAAKDTLKEIEINTDIINKLSERTPAVGDYEKAEEMLKNINNEFKNISEIALATDREYIKYKTKDYLTFKNVELSLVQKLSLKKVIALGAVFFVLICALFYFMSKRKLRNRRAHV